MIGREINLRDLAERIDLPIFSQDFAIIEQIDGKSIRDTYFEAGIPLHLSMPHFFVPFGSTVISDTIGLYLHPDAIAQKQIPVAALKEEGFLLEIAPSLTAYLQYLLIQQEAYHIEDGDDPSEEMVEELGWIEEVFGSEFYTLGQYGDDPEIFNTDVVDAIAIEQFGASPGNVLSNLIPKQSITDEIQRLEEGIAANSRSLALHTRLAHAYDKLGNSEAALQRLEIAFGCYYHNEYWNDLEKLHRLAKGFTNQGYTFSDRYVIQELAFASIQERVAWIVSVYEYGDLQHCAKLLDDLCYEVCTYSYAPVCNLLRQLYQQLGWCWLLPLMDQRCLLDEKDLARDFARKHLSPDWDAPLRSLITF